MKKLIEFLLLFIIVLGVTSCSSETNNNHKNPEDPNIVEPETKPNEKLELSETLSLVNLMDSKGYITGKLNHLNPRITAAINNQMKNHPVLTSISGNVDRSEIKDVDLPDGKITNVLKLGSKKGNSEAVLIFSENITSIKVKARSYYNYVSYNQTWVNDQNSKLIIKTAEDNKEFVLTPSLNSIPELLTCEYTFITPTNRIEFWSNNTENGRVIIEEITINYTKVIKGVK